MASESLEVVSFYVLLNVHISIILLINQLDASIWLITRIILEVRQRDRQREGRVERYDESKLLSRDFAKESENELAGSFWQFLLEI